MESDYHFHEIWYSAFYTRASLLARADEVIE
jgi:hypothetical protein